MLGAVEKSYILETNITYEMLQTLQSLRAFLESPKIEPAARALVEKVIGKSYLVCDGIVINVIITCWFLFQRGGVYLTSGDSTKAQSAAKGKFHIRMFNAITSSIHMRRKPSRKRNGDGNGDHVPVPAQSPLSSTDNAAAAAAKEEKTEETEKEETARPEPESEPEVKP